MKTLKSMSRIAVALLLFLFITPVHAALEKGALAPTFPALETEEKSPMVILYFFKANSKSSDKGLGFLKSSYEAYEAAGIRVIALNKDAPAKLEGYLKTNPLPFPVVKDAKTIFNNYNVQIILPTTVVLGPGGRVTDILQGGGASGKRFITTVADRSLQLNKSDLARTLYAQALKQDPKDAKAQAGLAKVYLKEGKLAKAESAFASLVSLSAPEAILGQEGLVAVHMERGETDKAIAMAEKIKKSEPTSGLVSLVRANVLAQRGDQDGALKAYKRAISGKLSTDTLRAEAYNKAGRIHSEREQYTEAESMYQEAVNQNPYSVEILTNRGALYEKQGQPKKALALYQNALSVDPQDEVAMLLSKRIAQHLDFEEDMARQKRVDQLVDDLSKRFQEGQLSVAKPRDSWSSRPMTVAFMGLKSSGGPLLREGMADVLQMQIAEKMMASGRISVVERDIMEKLLTELKLGSSDLADPDTALKLGKLLAARLIVTGNVMQVPGGIRLSLRLIDPETTAIKITHSDRIGPRKTIVDLAERTGRVLSERVRLIYPLRGKIALVDEDKQVIINLGLKHGIQPGIKMKIIAEGDAIVMDGKVLGYRKKKVGVIEITSVEEGLSYARLIQELGPIEAKQKVMEYDEPVQKVQQAF